VAGGRPRTLESSQRETERTRGWTRLQDPEDSTILVISFLKFCISNLFIILNSVLKKASTEVDPHYLDVWHPAHQGNADVAKKLVSISLYSYTLFVISVLNSIFCRTNIRRS
jgi:hypothetical protein